MKQFFIKGLLLATGVAIGSVATLGLPHLRNGLNKSVQPYAGQQERVISSLSASDIDQLQKGAGWGLAKPAEFNGYPGPAHVLEHADKLELSATQKQSIDTAFASMNARAKQLGEALIEAEAALDAAFKSETIDNAVLAKRVAAAEEVRAALRTTHLQAHLDITPLLSAEQKTLYAKLRGYAGGHTGH